MDELRAAWGLTIRDGYGQTETTAVIANSPGQPVKIGSMGRPMPGYQVVLLDVDDNEANEGEVALPVEPPTIGLTPGYRVGPHPPPRNLNPGCISTGDVAARDVDGYFTFVRPSR